jgi:hypothetical protein
MTQQLQSELWKAGASTFEEMGFVFAEPEVSEEQAEQGVAWCATVTLPRPRLGHVGNRILRAPCH